MKTTFVMSIALVLIGCANGPSEWAQRVVAESTCGISVAEAERIAGGELKELSGRSKRGTHVRRRGMSAVWFDFQNGKLTAVQPTWTAALKRDDDGPRRALCGPPSPRQ